MVGTNYRWDFPVIEKSPTKPERTRISLKYLVCFEFGCSINELLTPRGASHIIDAKMVYAYLTRKHLNDTLQRIALELEFKEHTNVINLLQRMQDIIFTKDERAKRMERVEQLIF